MSVIVNTNVPSLIAQNNLAKNTTALERAMQQLSSGSRINTASDDAAGLSIAEGMKIQINGNTRAKSNIEDGKNLLAVAEGGIVTVQDHLQRIRELCVQASNETYSDDQKDNMLVEIKQRLADIDTITATAKFNEVPLLDGTRTQLFLQVGAYSDATVNAIDIAPALSDVHTSVLGGDIRIPATTTGATWTTDVIHNYMDQLDVASTQLTSNRALLGAYGNRLQSTSDNLTIMNQNLEQSKSRITDADIAVASSEMVKNQILQQTSASILSQANQLPSIAMKLLG